MGGPRRKTSAHYLLLAEGKWRLPVLFRNLFHLIIESFGVEGLTLALDDTLCPKWGKQIYGTASYFDHAHRPRPGFIWGHRCGFLQIMTLAFTVAAAVGAATLRDVGEIRRRQQRVGELVRAPFLPEEARGLLAAARDVERPTRIDALLELRRLRALLP